MHKVFPGISLLHIHTSTHKLHLPFGHELQYDISIFSGGLYVKLDERNLCCISPSLLPVISPLMLSDKGIK